MRSPPTKRSHVPSPTATSATRRRSCASTFARPTGSSWMSSPCLAERRAASSHSRLHKEYVMPQVTTTRAALHQIETASREEISALQLERLQWTLAHAYEHVPHYRA